MRLTITFLMLGLACIAHASLDTTIVQTFTWAAQNNPNTAYDSPGRRWFDFPASDNGVEYQKILMYYNLKCFDQGTAGNLGYPCGEWDYLTYTYLYDHTGVMDSTQAQHPHYLVNHAPFDTALLTQEPVFLQQSFDQVQYVVDAVDQEYTAWLGDTLEQVEWPTAGRLQKAVFLYRADELIQAGFQAGMPFGQLAFMMNGAPADVEWLNMRFALTTDAELVDASWPSNTAEVFNQHSLFQEGIDPFTLGPDFSWDGVSNVLLCVSFRNPNGPTPQAKGSTTDYASAAWIGSDDRYLHFDWQDVVEVPASAFDAVSDQLSISLWQYGDPNFQPENGTLFEGVNSLNQRVVNVHLPWSNSNVYWDCGYNGGYDRINKLAAIPNFEGRWNHWVFTKDATAGVMQIYLNGVLWHTGSNLDNLISDVQRFTIGGACGWVNYYHGSIDEFAIFNSVLSASDIQQLMARDIDATHPQWSHLQVYYPFNEQDGEQILDASGNNRNAWMLGNAAHVDYQPEEQWRNVSLGQMRPAIQLPSGVYTMHTDTIQVQEMQLVPPVSIAEYTIVDYRPQLTEVTYAWQEQMTYVFDAQGIVVDSLWVPADTTLLNDTLTYWNRPFEVVDRYELNRFITMYGIQLTLGTDGWTWVVDVTDWAPLLRDSVELEAGNWQELLDMKFVFIEGPAPRDVKRVERVWDTNQSLSNFDQAVTTRTIQKLPGEEGWKLLTTNTGHQFDNPFYCAEFCNNLQTVEVNGQGISTWDILQECADNPLYPQGGTWIYDRAGWCPGMNSTTKEFELTPHVGTGDTFDLDYDIEYNDYGNYVFFGTLIGYGAPNQQVDPEIDMITAPSDWKIHSRWNPICDEAKFVLRNKGAQELTHVKIEYGVIGGATETFDWSGSLGFMEREEVSLTYHDPIMYNGSAQEQLTFFIRLVSTNDGTDENTSNNEAHSTFHRPVVYGYSNLDENRLIIQLKTNNANTETSYTLYDMAGNVVFERSDFPLANTTYRDTLAINAGCYLFHLKDLDDDGLDFFANDDGAGNCKFDRIQGLDFINFERDFGKEIKHHFYWNTNAVSVEESPRVSSGLRVFPNPGTSAFTLDITGFDRVCNLEAYDVQGRLIHQERLSRKSSTERIQVNASSWPSGIYALRISDDQAQSFVRWVKE